MADDLPIWRGNASLTTSEIKFPKKGDTEENGISVRLNSIALELKARSVIRTRSEGGLVDIEENTQTSSAISGEFDNDLYPEFVNIDKLLESKNDPFKHVPQISEFDMITLARLFEFFECVLWYENIKDIPLAVKKYEMYAKGTTPSNWNKALRDRCFCTNIQTDKRMSQKESPKDSKIPKYYYVSILKASAEILHVAAIFVRSPHINTTSSQLYGNKRTLKPDIDIGEDEEDDGDLTVFSLHSYHVLNFGSKRTPSEYDSECC